MAASVVTCQLAADTNSNAWYPPATTPDIHVVELFTFHGLPNDTQSHDLKILVNHAYAVAFSEELKVPLYAVYRYGNSANAAEDVKERYFERPPKFQLDLRTEARVHTDDYRNGLGYQRGHMAPNYGLRFQYGHLAQIESFFMSNIPPQHESLNTGVWMKAEHRIATDLAQDDNQTQKSGDDIKDLWGISGPSLKVQSKPCNNQVWLSRMPSSRSSSAGKTTSIAPSKLSPPTTPTTRRLAKNPSNS